MRKFSPQFTITNSITSGLTQIERARGFLEAATLSEDWISRMSQRALLLEAHHTTHIEGTQLTLEESATLWNGGTIENANPDDKQELLNYRDAFNLVSDYLRDASSITENLIRKIHKKLVQGVRGGEGQPGKYRTVQNCIVNSRTEEIIYMPPGPGDVPALMQQFVQWLNENTDIHPVLVAAISQFQLVHIHPFIDGNGRTSRLLSTLYLYQNGYDFKRLFTISEYYDRNKIAFYNAIQSVRENDMDLTSWLTYFVTGLATQLEEVKANGINAIKSDIIAREHKLNQRQILGLNHLFMKSRLTITDYEILCPEINRRTLQRDLKNMLDKGLLLCKGATNNLVYQLSEE
jgi:cell filamentation protein, protein adenylyltransferase